MSLKVCLAVKALSFPRAGGHLWVYLNWALALRSLGWDVVWMEAVSTTDQNIEEHFAALKARLEPFGLADSIALYAKGSGRCLSSNYGAPVSVGEALRSDLLLNFGYDDVPAALVASFRRSALVDILKSKQARILGKETARSRILHNGRLSTREIAQRAITDPCVL